METSRLYQFVDRCWERSILPAIEAYIRIPNLSPQFDPDWAAHGYMEEALHLAEQWCLRQPIPGMLVEVMRLPGRTPLLFVEVPGDRDDCVLLYGHLDKQPEMSGWRAGLGPWTPVREDEKLYGRGGADDGYAVFAALSAILALRNEGLPHARCVLVIECSEESGSPDLPAYVEALKDRIGSPSLVVCLDSGCGNYEQLWCTTSLRGLIGGTLRIDVLEEGVHSGDAGGIIPSTFQILRDILARLEDSASGTILPGVFHATIPPERVAQAKAVADAMGETVFSRFPLKAGVTPLHHENAQLVLNRAWAPALEVLGARGLPPVATAGNVLRPFTEVKLSLRLPPTVDPETAIAALQRLVTENPPFGAQVSFEPDWRSGGWNAPPLAEWLAVALSHASERFFGKPAMYVGEGFAIPFIGMLAREFPQAQFLITGVLGPHSNAHGPNEFLHIPFAKRLTASVASVLASHADR